MGKRGQNVLRITFFCLGFLSIFLMALEKRRSPQSEMASSQNIWKEKTKTTQNNTFSVYAGGEQIGIYIKTKGVLVVSLQGVKTEDGICYPAKEQLQVGDYILKLNEKTIQTKAQFVRLLQEENGKECELRVQRKDAIFTVKVTPAREKESKVWQLGVWLRNNTQGIGTLTYVMPGGTYGALGHSITDYELGCSMPLEQGSIYHTSIYSIQKGKKGKPGELIGNIRYNKEEYLGTVEKNTAYGISGKITNHLANYQKGNLIQVAREGEVRDGIAFVRSSVSGKSMDYKICIRKNRSVLEDKQKSLIIEITDKRLLKLTGGIVQGLSGSPIIQNGKLIGAITHVLVDDASKGYGIMINDMLGL